MNEVSNFGTNTVGSSLVCPENKWDDPPYETSNFDWKFYHHHLIRNRKIYSYASGLSRRNGWWSCWSTDLREYNLHGDEIRRKWWILELRSAQFIRLHSRNSNSKVIEHFHQLFLLSNIYITSHPRAAREIFPGKRSMVLSRSTFAGSGSFAGYWSLNISSSLHNCI